jgi:alpha-N-arabinofuranosidase
MAGLTAFAFICVLQAAEFHVATSGSDTNPGTKKAPFRTVQHAADMAHPGDVVTVHAGVYRERISPPRGGTSDAKRIVYQAARGERVEIKGSEVIRGWVRVQNDVWKVTLPNSFFGSFNPYRDLIRGDWFNAKGREHHTGAVYLNSDWLAEAAKMEDVLKPTDETPLWFGKVEADNTTIWAQFKGVNPNEQLVEINVRQSVFYPNQPGCNFITVRGFTLRDAATPWSPPTAEQIGLIGTHWSKGWIIESNVISHSISSGVTLGKHGDKFDNNSASSADGYVKTIERAHAFTIPWTRENIGHHIVRNNTISHCEQAGIVGSLGAAFSTITGNTIHDIHVRQLFTGYEQAGIKFHGAIDTDIRGNHIYRAYRGLWLDWMAQGTRVTANLFHGNSAEDIYVEVNHGPFLVDNNLLLSSRSLLDMSEGGAYVHNLITGKIDNWYDMKRLTPHLQPHSTVIAGLTVTQGGDNSFFNNIFVGQGLPGDAPLRTVNPQTSITGFGLWVYDTRDFLLQAGGNVYYHGAQPYAKETNPVTLPAADPNVKVVEEGGQTFIQCKFGPELKQVSTKLVTTALLGKAKIAGLAFDNAAGSPLKIDADYFGRPRNKNNPTPGPFEDPGLGNLKLNVW